MSTKSEEKISATPESGLSVLHTCLGLFPPVSQAGAFQAGSTVQTE